MLSLLLGTRKRFFYNACLYDENLSPEVGILVDKHRINKFLILTFIILLKTFQEEFRKRRLTLDNALKEEVQREAALLARVEKEKEAKCELARRSDKQDQRQMYVIYFLL
jgi:hypothetical protein